MAQIDLNGFSDADLDTLLDMLHADRVANGDSEAKRQLWQAVQDEKVERRQVKHAPNVRQHVLSQLEARFGGGR